VNFYPCFTNITRYIDRKLSYIRGICLYFGNDFGNDPLDDKEVHLTFHRAVRVSVPNEMSVMSGTYFAYGEVRKSRLPLDTTCQTSSVQ